MGSERHPPGNGGLDGGKPGGDGDCHNCEPAVSWGFDESSERVELPVKVVYVTLLERWLRVDVHGDVAATPEYSELSVGLDSNGVSRSAAVHHPRGCKDQEHAFAQRLSGN